MSSIDRLESYYDKDVDEFGRDTHVPLDVILEICGEEDLWWVVENAIPEGLEQESANFMFAYVEALLGVIKENPLDRQSNALLEMLKNGECIDEAAIREPKKRLELLTSTLKKYCEEGRE